MTNGYQLSLGKKWKDNVSEAPVLWDRDEHFLNYVMHLLFWWCLLHALDTRRLRQFWVFYTLDHVDLLLGIRCVCCRSSWQDLFTPFILGAVVGELMLEAEQDIVASGGANASCLMGDASFFLNPVGHIHYWVSDAAVMQKLTWNTNPWWITKMQQDCMRDAAHLMTLSLLVWTLKLRSKIGFRSLEL